MRTQNPVLQEILIMARMARKHCCPDAPAQHVWNRVAGPPDYYPFGRRPARSKFLELLERYRRVYCLRLCAALLMGNHFHLVLDCPPFRPLPRSQLLQRACLLWGPKKATLKTAHWDDRQWEEFNRKLFSLSRFMHHLEGEFAKWFNRTYRRRGHFWAHRFGNNGLFGRQALQDTVLYVELNPVRAGLVQRPEQWKWGSACWRARGKDQQLVPLIELFPPEPGKDVYQGYRGMLIYRGTEPSKEGDAVIPEWVLRQEQRRGFRRPGIFRQSLRLFRDGVGLGSRRQMQQQVDRLCDEGYYTQRCHPISHLDGLFFTVREQRSHAVPT